jgi:hypothetical protein
MVLRDEDVHEDDLSRSEEPNTVTQTSHAGHPSHVHPQLISSYKFMSLVQSVSGKHFEIPENERYRSPMHPNKFHKHHENSARKSIKSPIIY